VTFREYGDHYIDGRWVASQGNVIREVISPHTEEPCATVALGAARDIDDAVRAAAAAYRRGGWSGLALEERIAVLERARDLVAERAEEFAQLITAEMGCPITQSRSMQVQGAIATMDAYLAVAPQVSFRSVRKAPTGNALVVREPIGVTAAVSPWNAPFVINAQKVIPALLAGGTVVLKPSTETPLDAYLFAEIMHEAGLPAGVFNVVAADRQSTEGLIRHPDVNKVTFTGSTAVGRHLAAMCGEHLRPITLELGGKSAAIILDDADLERTVEALRGASLRNSGQVCSLKTRLLVSERRHAEFVERLVAMVESMRIGDPTLDETEIGPMVSSKQRETVNGYISAGLQEGARRVTRADLNDRFDRGWYVTPTVFTDVSPNMRIAREEIFGPVLSVLTYRTENEAVELANNSDYGLNGAVFSEDVERAMSLAGRIQTGTVEINGHRSGYLAPMGGVGASGLGRVNGPEGIEEYTELKSIGINQEVAERILAEEDIYSLSQV
jgi:aldehyde dehydrogenase (NAD+)